jgi:shikimate dehydrogenase
MNDLRRFGLLGDPVNHSLSPRLYGAAFAHLRIPATYEARPVPLNESADLRRRMLEFGVAGGGNVTVPHKLSAAWALDLRSSAVGRTGACNCFWIDSAGRLSGDNTDVGGFLHACTELDGLELEGASVLILGAGGAARAVAVACADSAVGHLGIRNRTADRAEDLITDLAIERVGTVCSDTDISSYVWDLVVNATSLGLDPDDELPLLLDPDLFRHALDLVYGPVGTAWTRHAASLGIPAKDGHPMLVSQALLSLDRWLGPVEDRSGVAAAMWKGMAVVPDSDPT